MSRSTSTVVPTLVPYVGIALLAPFTHASPDALATPPVPATPSDAGGSELAGLFARLRAGERWVAQDEEAPPAKPLIPSIRLDDEGDWVANFGGELRGQARSETNLDFLGGPDSHVDKFVQTRVRLHGELVHRDDLRFFVEGLTTNDHGNEAPAGPSEENDPDLLNAYVEFTGGTNIWRFGRTELNYGAQRLISSDDWRGTPRSFQGGVFRHPGERSVTDLFLVHPVVVAPHAEDQSDDSVFFGGVYSTFFTGDRSLVDVYGLVLRESNDSIAQSEAPGAVLGDMTLYTVGGRVMKLAGRADYEAEVAYQFGDRVGDSIGALAYSGNAGYTLDEWRGKPRFGLGLDFASGDDGPNNGKYDTFNQLFANGHEHFGYLDIVGRQNVNAFGPNMSVNVAPSARLRVAYLDLELANTHDYLYDSNGQISSPDSALDGDGGKDIGQEWDITLDWQPSDWPETSTVLFGYSRLDPGKFVDGYGDGHDAQRLYVQYRLAF